MTLKELKAAYDMKWQNLASDLRVRRTKAFEDFGSASPEYSKAHDAWWCAVGHQNKAHGQNATKAILMHADDCMTKMYARGYFDL